MSTTKTSKKYLSVVTYCIALVCLLLGLFLPLYNGDGLLFMAIPQAFCTTFGITGDIPGEALSRTFEVTFAGAGTYDFAPLLVTLYAAIAAIGIIMLIPVFACKTTKKGANVCAYIVEVAAAVVLFVYALLQVLAYIDGTYGENAWDYGVVHIALGGTLLMLIIQSLGYKKGSGVVKLVVTVLGAVGVLCLLNIPKLFKLSTTTLFDGNLFIGYFTGAFGIEAVNSLVGTGITNLFGDSLAQMVACIAVGCGGLLAIGNLAFDIIALGANTKKGTLVFDVIRYLIQTILLILGVVMLFVLDNDVTPGLLMYILLAVALIQLIIASVRCGIYKPAQKAESSYTGVAPVAYVDDTVAANAPVPQQQPAYAQPQQPAYVQPVYLQPVYAAPAAPAAAAQPAPQAHQGEVVYTAKEVYHGPTDSFIARLSESEKIEFSKLFLEKINGPYANVPDYVVGGDNKDFFTSIFIYLGKFRSLISDGLMNKIYNELNLLG